MRISLPQKLADPTKIRPAGLTDKAFARLLKPTNRGTYFNDDAARAQLGLLVARSNEAKVFALINLDGNVVREIKFLSYGQARTVAIADAFCELAKGRRFEEACSIPLSQVEALLRDDSEIPAFGEEGLGPFQFINDLQTKLKEGRPAVKLLPKPEEKVLYIRKAPEDMNDADRAWLPLSLMKKLEATEAVLKNEVAGRLKLTAKDVEIDGLHDDLVIVLKFLHPKDEAEMPIRLGLAQDIFRSRLHPDITVKEAGV